MRACRTAFEAGKNQVKLHFMNGLPTETKEDIEGIAKLASDVIELYYSLPGILADICASAAHYVQNPSNSTIQRSAGLCPWPFRKKKEGRKGQKCFVIFSHMFAWNFVIK